MSGKILSIQKQVPKESTLPDGVYTGTWGGYNIEVRYGGETYDLKTDEGVRGIGFKVVVNIKDGIATFEDLKN